MSGPDETWRDPTRAGAPGGWDTTQQEPTRPVPPPGAPPGGYLPLGQSYEGTRQDPLNPTRPGPPPEQPPPAPPPPGPGQDGTFRFGPGVQASPVEQTWRSGRAPGPRRKRGRGLISALITTAIVAGVVIWILLQSKGDGLAVESMRVQTPKKPKNCATSVDITGVINTNGKAGTLTYRWLQSDGGQVGQFDKEVEKGQKEITVPLHWTIKGKGKGHFVATLELLEPQGPVTKAAAAFDYTCG